MVVSSLYVCIFLVKTAPVLLLPSWICGGQVSLDDHSEWLYHHLVGFEATFVRRTSLYVCILQVKTTPILKVSTWICGGQGSLDDHSEWLYHHLV